MRISSAQLNVAKEWRGGEQQALYLLEGLRNQQQPVILIGHRGSPLLQRAEDQGIPTLPLTIRGEGDILSAFRIAQELKRLHADILHCHTPHSHGLGLLTRLFSRRHKLVVARRVDFSVARFGRHPRSQIKSKGMSARTGIALLDPRRLNLYKYRIGVDRIISSSHAIREVLIQDGIPSHLVEVVHDAIECSRFNETWNHKYLYDEFGLSRDTLVIGNIAALVDHKGHRYLIDAIPQVVQHFPNVRFFVIGSGELKASLEVQAQKLGLQEYVNFTGFRDDIPALLHIMSIFVMSSHKEGLGTSILDAMATGVPVVATNAGGIPEIVRDGETGLLVEPKNPRALAESIIRMIKDEALRDRLAREARKMVQQQFSIPKMVEATLEVYARVVGEDACPQEVG